MRTCRWAIAAAFLLCPLRLDAATEARFTLGLTGEALSALTEVDGAESKRSSLGGAVLLGVDGALVDRRFLSFGGFLRYSAFDQTETGVTRSELGYDQWSYGGNFRAFSNRKLTLAGTILHAVSSPTGESTGAIVGGVQDIRGVEAAFRTRGFPDFSYSFEDSRFTADDPETLRDQSRRRHTMKALASYGIVRAALEARQEDVEFFSGIVRQDLRYGFLNLDVNRGGKTSWETVLNANQVRIASGDAAFSDPTTVLFTRNRFRHQLTQESYFDLVYSRQSSEDSQGSLDSDSAAAAAYVQLSKSVRLEMRLSYISQEGARDGAEGRIQQPAASVGIRWSGTGAGWNLLAYPRLAYVATSAPGRETESGLGGELYLSAQRAWSTGSSFLVELDGFYNQLTIAPLDPNGSPTDPSFLSGLEKNRLRGRVAWTRGLGPRSRLTLQADASQRVRFVDGRDITESQVMANAGVSWRTLSARVAGSANRQKDAEIPTETTILQADVAWNPLRWLQLDAVGSAERRSVLGDEGEYQYLEGGIRFLYARLAFYARVRETRSSGTDGPERLDRRFWAGVSRTFDFPGFSFGRNGSRNGHRNGNGVGRGNGSAGGQG